MAESRTLAGFRAPLLFLKATKKKQVFIPTYTRHDGVVLPGHYAKVHVADDHRGEKILGGQGMHSQKQAHANLRPRLALPRPSRPTWTPSTRRSYRRRTRTRRRSIRSRPRSRRPPPRAT